MLTSREKELGADYISTLDAVNNLGVIYCQRGKLDEAEQMHKRALAGREKALGADHIATFETFNNVGILYCMKGKTDASERAFMEVLARREKALGADHHLHRQHFAQSWERILCSRGPEKAEADVHPGASRVWEIAWRKPPINRRDNRATHKPLSFSGQVGRGLAVAVRMKPRVRLLCTG